MNYRDYTDKLVAKKQRFAKRHGKGKKVLKFVLEQIEVLEQLGKGLTEKQILELLEKDNETQVQNTCRTLKIA